MIRSCLILLVVGLLGQVAVMAGEAPRYNQVQLAAQASEQVGNDTLQVEMTTWGEQRELGQLAARLNADMEWALGKTRSHPAIKGVTGSYQTYPLTSKDGRTTTGWRGQQTLTLESRSIAELSELAGALQERLRITAMQFTVSAERRETAVNHMIDVALDAFRARARLVADNLKARDFRIVELSINTAGSQSPPVLYRNRAMSASMEADTTLAVESGESEVRVDISGTIELVLP